MEQKVQCDGHITALPPGSGCRMVSRMAPEGSLGAWGPARAFYQVSRSAPCVARVAGLLPEGGPGGYREQSF